MPASCLTSSGWPLRSATSSRGWSSVDRTATVPEMTRIRSAATPSKSSVVGASTVQCCIVRPSCPKSNNKIYRVCGKSTGAAIRRPSARNRDGGHRPSGTWQASCPRPGFLLVVVVEPGQPAGQAVHRRLELRGQVDELTQPLRQPAQADLVVRPPLGEFLDALVGGVHRPS